MNKEETKLVLTCNVMRGTRKITSCAFTEQGLLLTFKLEREPMQSEVRYDAAADSSVTCTEQMFVQATLETARCKLALHLCPQFYIYACKGCSFGDLSPPPPSSETVLSFTSAKETECLPKDLLYQ